MIAYLTLALITNTIIDFSLQPSWIAKEKLWFNKAMNIHALMITSGIAFWGILAFGVSYQVVLWILVNFFSHAIIDTLEIKVRRGATPKDKFFWTVLGFGEALHTLIIASIFVLQEI